ncbi:N-acetylmuramoyl-L-alanine amidase [Rubrobacter calidifluminis]|uniref:N-acetylmuramoyl-L-alanine amidase n=1 Tax=Rubrobacter calidifluminis TaxID=1392640 RepID=UPI00235FE039|nr:N-acetylmuramoyl-L-alanine amidase [Rubrobacter calidifluminis]
MRSKTFILLALCAAVVCLAAGSHPVGARQQGAAARTISGEVSAASHRYGVPARLLLAMGYVNTRWETPPPSPYRKGDPEARGTFGVMQLADNPYQHTLGLASGITGISQKRLEQNRAANVMGAAAVLAHYAGKPGPQNINGWRGAVARYGGGEAYAEQVYQTLRQGASTRTSSGERVVVPRTPGARAPQASYAPSAVRADYSRARWYGTNGNNFTPANRPHDLRINRIIIHVTQGSWASAINWFKDPRAQSSAHYVIRSKDGYVGQSVREKNIAWHAANWDYNQHSIGIEHEGYINDPRWFTDAMYRSSARLVAHLCRKYHIPIDRKHIIGHNQVPGADHTDPGPYWNWTKYMRYVRSYAGATGGKPVYQQVVDNASVRFHASKDWHYNTWNKAKYGRNYRAARPKSVSDPATFYVKVPTTSDYAVYARWPASSDYNDRTPILIRTTSGFRKVVVNQRRNGGKWVKLGTFQMPEGKKRSIMISRWTSGRGWVIADAVMIRRYR